MSANILPIADNDLIDKCTPIKFSLQVHNSPQLAVFPVETKVLLAFEELLKHS